MYTMSLQAAAPTLRRRRAVQLQGEQQQEEELLRHASPSRDNGGAEQQAERSPKRRSGIIPSQLWADASQLQPPGSPPAAPEHHPPLTLADLKAEMQASSAAKRGWACACWCICPSQQMRIMT